MNIYFTSDTHAYHKNIVKGSTQWSDKDRCRDFDNEEKMTETLIKNINDNVKYDDVLYHLGDVAFGGIDKLFKFRDRLNVRKIHLIYGNHDHHIINNRQYDGRYAQDLFTSCQYYLEKKIMGQRIIMCHYAMRVWNKSHHGSWMFYGHSHGTLPEPKCKSTDVGVDTHPEFRPYSFDEVKARMDSRIVDQIDHHSSRTN